MTIIHDALGAILYGSDGLPIVDVDGDGIAAGPYVSPIARQLRNANEIHFLLILDFDGTKKYYSDANISFGDHQFEDKILSISDIKSSFDIRNFKYSFPSISITIKNPFTSEDRLQDLDALKVLDGSVGDIYIWATDISWELLMEEGPKFSGIFQENIYDSETFTFNLVDKSESKFSTLTNKYIDSNTFPYHPSEYSGNVQPLIFGAWGKGVPLDCIVDEAIYGFSTINRYLISINSLYSSVSCFITGQEHIFSSSGVTYSGIVNVGGTTITTAIDNEGTVYSYINFNDRQTASEPLNCSIKGVKDIANNLIEHPANIFEFVCNNYSNLTPSEVDKVSVNSFKAIMPFAKCASIVNDNIEAPNFIDRIFSPFLCARITVGNKIGIMIPDLNDSPIARFSKDFNNVGERISITKTDYNLICNDLTVFYNLNPATGKYQSVVKRNKSNSEKCESSYYNHKEKLFQKTLKFSDINDSGIAEALAERYLDFYAHRHHIMSIDMKYGDAYDLKEGDLVLWTIPEGGRTIPGGWVDEKFILLEKAYKKEYISTVWWKVSTVASNKQMATSSGGAGSGGSSAGYGWLGDGWLGEGWL